MSPRHFSQKSGTGNKRKIERKVKKKHSSFKKTFREGLNSTANTRGGTDGQNLRSLTRTDPATFDKAGFKC